MEEFNFSRVNNFFLEILYAGSAQSRPSSDWAGRGVLIKYGN
jgi:hypothetical protein